METNSLRLFSSNSLCCVKRKILQNEKNPEIDHVTFAVVKYTIKSTNKIKTTYIKDTVIKYYTNDRSGRKEFINEINILNHINLNINDQDLKVPNLLYHKKHKSRPCELYTQRINGNDIGYLLGNTFSFVDQPLLAHHIILKIAKSLAALHNNGIAHRDIKLENIILDLNNNIIVYLIDFAYSCQIIDGVIHESKIRCGTLEYASPELVTGDCAYHLLANDVWCFGVLIFAMHTGFYLRRTTNDIKKYTLSCRKQVKEYDIPPLLKRILCKIFVGQRRRITMRQIVTILEKDFL